MSEFLVEVAKAGYGKSRQQVKSLAANAIHDKDLLDPGGKLSNGWYYRFINRHQQLVLRKGDPTANVRMDSVNKETMENYFSLLKDTLEQYDLLNNPSQIYNVDEMGMPLDHHPPKIVTTRGQKKVRCRTSGNRSQITVIACVSAVGQVIPPFVIFDSKSLNQQWTKGEVVGTRYGLSSSGCGIYPFDPDVIDYGVPANDDSSSKPSNSNSNQQAPLDAVTSCQTSLNAVTSHLPIFAVTSQQLPLGAVDSQYQTTSEQEQLFQKRYEEQYDFPDPVYRQWLKVNHPTTELVKENRVIEIADPELSLEQEQEEYDNYDFPNPFSDTQDWPQEDQVVEFSPEQVLLFQKRFEEKYDVPDPVYQQWLKINHPTTAGQVHDSQMFKFTSDQERLFQRRFEENYDLPDPVYQQWLKINHPTV